RCSSSAAAARSGSTSARTRRAGWRRCGGPSARRRRRRRAGRAGVMQIGMVGLGRMGGSMARRLMRGGHEVVAYATHPEAVRQLAADGATGTATLDDVVGKLEPPRVAWVMVPAGVATEQVGGDLAKRFEPGDTIVDGGNTFYKDDVRRMKMLREKQIHYVDV